MEAARFTSLCTRYSVKCRRANARTSRVVAVQSSQRSQPDGRRRVVLLWTLAGALSLAIIAFAIWLLPLLLTRHPSAGLTPAARLKAENDARTSVLAALAVVAAAAITARYTWRAAKSTLAGQQIDRDRQQIDRERQETDRQAQITDRYTKAIDQLGSDKVDVRIGGIYALERLALDSARDHPIVMEVLTAFVRERAREPQAQLAPGAQASRGPAAEPVIRPDIQAALTVIGRRNSSYDRGRIDFAGAYLAGANLSGRGGSADFARADLSNVDLTSANLTGANLTGALMTGANLDGADLTRANLQGADLSRANLTGANLMAANLANATLISASLGGVFLGHAKLVRASLVGASLGESYLGGADLSGANLTRANLTRANLADANLQDAYFPDETRVPNGWMRDHSGRLTRTPSEPSSRDPRL